MSRDAWSCQDRGRELEIGQCNLRAHKGFSTRSIVVVKQEMMGRNRETALTETKLLEARVDRFQS